MEVVENKMTITQTLQPPYLLEDQAQNKFKRLHCGLNFLSELAKGERADDPWMRHYLRGSETKQLDLFWHGAKSQPLAILIIFLKK